MGFNGYKEICTDKYGAVTAVALGQMAACHGAGRVTVADSWFGTYAVFIVTNWSKHLKRASPRVIEQN